MAKDYDLAQFKGEFQVDPVARALGIDGKEYFEVVNDSATNIHAWGVYGLLAEGKFTLPVHLCDCPTEEIAVAIKEALERIAG